MNRVLLFFITLNFISACQVAKTNQSSQSLINHQLAPDSIQLKIEALNLSEDMSKLSTKNDELLILIYDQNDSAALGSPLFERQITLDQSRRSVIWVLAKDKFVRDKLLFVLIEQDTNKPMVQIEALVRVNYQRLMKAHLTKDYSEIQRYLGDEDIIGIKKISKLPIAFSFHGIHKMDMFEYKINLH